jgi:hypothetical protein
MDSFAEQEFSAEYFALKAANDLLRERGKQWLWNMFDRLISEASQELAGRDDQPPLQIGRQEWQFKISQGTMVGERLGARHRTRTLTVEVGWPRLPEHGFIPDGGLARARIGLSQNVMLEAGTIAEFCLRREGEDEPAWYVISDKRFSEKLSESHLREYLNMILA